MTKPLGPEAQSEILSAITARLQMVLPAGWRHLQIDYTAVGDTVISGGLLRMENGGMVGVALPEDVDERFGALRAGMANPETGAWLHATYRLDYPDAATVEYDRQQMPLWDDAPSGADCTRELELYPRAAEFVPEWMRERLTSR
ncbi:hypothetical protein [Nocardia mexicana]|uniref:DUF600 family protein n=1 Tax=Nocardia mexicana TaxID=279262 RepID=A0A370GS62_9NOCA|nr:hypothetical protein [Nocardia mexicana]RDI46160.1 hypothetical protein DFR68_11261 [Nocardia mexicana]